jgi:hypothetical protein
VDHESDQSDIVTRVVAQPDEFGVLERDLQPDLLDLTFTDHPGKTARSLRKMRAPVIASGI